MEDLFSGTDKDSEVVKSENLLIRCSQLGLLMTPPKGKSNLDKYNDVVELLSTSEAKYNTIVNKETKTAIKLVDKITSLKKEVSDLDKIKHTEELSETARKLIQSIWLYNKYGYKEDVVTDGMLKGLLYEQDNMALVQSVVGGEFRVKNDETKQNDYIIGCCDIPLKKEDVIEDLKSSQNLRTFFEAEFKIGDRYYSQGQGYMWLWEKKNYRLIYGLVPVDDDAVIEQQKRFWYKFNCDDSNEDYIKIAEQIKHNNELIKSIPEKERVKVFEFAYDVDFIEKVKEKHSQAVVYYNSLSL